MPEMTKDIEVEDRRFSVEEVENGWIVRVCWREKKEVKGDGDVMYPDFDYKSDEYVAKTIEEVNMRFAEWAGGK